MKVMGYAIPKLRKKRRAASHVAAYARVGEPEVSDRPPYDVARYEDGRYGCTCPSKLYRRRWHCKHIKAFKEFERERRTK